MKIFYKTHTPAYRQLLHIVLFFLLIIQCTVVSAQKPASNQVAGVVYDQAGATIIGASVVIEGTTRGTITDITGKFNLETGSAKVKLTFSYLGFISQTVEVTPGSTFDITLVEESTQLEGFVVVGYGTQRKKDLTGAVAVVDVKEMKKMQPPTIGRLCRDRFLGFR